MVCGVIWLSFRPLYSRAAYPNQAMNDDPALDVGLPSPQAVPPPLPTQKPRVWPALVVAISALGAALLGSGILLVIFLINTHGADILGNEEAVQAAITAASMDSVGFLVISLPGQLAFLGTALCAALLSRGRWTSLLGYRQSAFPWWLLALLAVATPFVTSLGVLLQRYCFGGDSEHLERLGQMAAGPGDGFALTPLLVIGLLAPIAEETLFRGYIQQRLMKGWKPWLAITVSNAFFLAAHLEPSHIVALVPLGFWLGFVAWRAKSVWPAMVCHAAQNLLFVFAHQTGMIQSMPETLAVFGLVSILAFGAAAISLWRYRKLDTATGINLNSAA